MSTESSGSGAEQTQSDRSDSGHSQSDDTAPLVFPVGHYMGPFHPKLNAPAKHHIVRVGWDTPKLPDEAHLDIWALAHGRPNAEGTVRWTRQAIIESADEAGMPDAAAILDTLADLGLIAEVTPGTGQAREFAASYRLQSLMIGLGNTREDPVLDGIGLAGIPPVVKVRPRVFEVWQWVHLWPSLWGACEGLAWVAGQAAEQAEDAHQPEDADPEALLEFILEAMRTLISRSAVYLDLATTDGAGGGDPRRPVTSGAMVPERPSEISDALGEATASEDSSHADPAQESYQLKLTRARELGDRAGEAGARRGLAREAFADGSYEQAATEYRRAIKFHLELGDQVREADTRCELARVELEDTEYVQALRRTLERYHDVSTGVGLWWGGGGRRLRLAAHAGRTYTAYKEAMRERARSESRHALELYRKLGDHAGEARAHGLLAVVSSEQGAHERARAEYGHALELYRDLGDHAGEAHTRQRLAEIERVIQRIRELEPAAYAQVAKHRESNIIRFLLPQFSLLATVLTAIWALTGLDSEWPFYVLFSVGAGFIMVVIQNSRAPVKNSLLAFALGTLVTVSLWMLTGMGSILPFQALLVWGWFCGSGAIRGRRRVARLSEVDVGKARSIAWSAALHDIADERGECSVVTASAGERGA